MLEFIMLLLENMREVLHFLWTVPPWFQPSSSEEAVVLDIILDV